MSDPEHQNPFEAPEPDEVALLFPAYDVHSLIACGGMGAVYHATQRSLARGVAIKILPREFSRDEAFRTGFEAEAKAMAKLNHPNLIGVYDFGEVDGMLYIVMEFVEGKSLHQVVHGGALEQADAVRVIIDVCHGLAHAHDNGILHRDIKPGNILLDANGNPKIGDFGLARALEKEIEEGEQIFGTPGYTAPEVIEPPFSFDHRADIFSVGVMLQELLTGKTPEAGAAASVQVGNPRLAAIIRQAVDPDPARRYASAEKFASALGRIVGSAPKSLVTASSPSRAARPFTPPLGRSYKGASRAKKSDSSGTLVVVILVAVVIAVVAFVITKSKPSADAADGKEPSSAVVTPAAGVSPEADSEEPAPVAFDADSAIGSAVSAIQTRLSPDIESHKRAMRNNAEAFRSELSEAIPGGGGSLLENSFASWQADGYRIPATLPDEFAAYPGAGELHGKHLAAQTELEEKFSERVDLQSGVYILALEDRIEPLDAAENAEAIRRIEAEIEKVRGDPAYFRSLMTD